MTNDAFAQRTVTGKVTSDDGEGMPAVSVGVKGTTKGAITDGNGAYSVEVPAEGKILVFTFIGYKTQEVEIGAQSTIDVTMASDDIKLQTVEIITNALGFDEEKERIGSAVSKIDAGAIVKSGETGVINGMAGKAAGVQIIRSSGDPGASSYIQIRGQSTFSGSTQPLIVIDGVPMSNDSYGSGTAGVAQQSRMNDINPDDIASMQILKGPSAAALWGSRAANGVIVITTKKGSGTDGKINITYRTAVSVDIINKMHPLQETFGQGAGGSFSATSPFSYGDKLSSRTGAADDVDKSGRYFESNTGNKIYPMIAKNDSKSYLQSNMDQVFGNGYFWDNSLSLGGGNADGNIFVSFSDINQKGIIKNNSDYRRTTMRVNAEKKVNKFVKLSTNVTYSQVNSNRVQKGSNLAGLFLGLLRTPSDFDNRDYKGTYVDAAGNKTINRHRSYRRYLGDNANPTYNNPGWTINEQVNTNSVNRVLGKVQLDVTPTNWLALIGRVGVDSYTDKKTTGFPWYSAGITNGSADENTIASTQMQAEFLGRAEKQINEDLYISGILGTQFNSRRLDQYGTTLNALMINDVRNFTNFSNATTANKSPYDYNQVILNHAAYSQVNVAFKDMIFWNATGRYEVSSTYNGGYFFPSTDLSFNFTQLDALKDNSILSFGKIRASVGKVGIQPAPYSSTTYYEGSGYSEGWGTTLDGALYGGGFAYSNSLGNNSLKPEVKQELEVGTDLRFLDDKIRFSASYYTNKNQNALFSPAIAPSTGFTEQYLNAANITNKGIELEISADVIKKGDFTWTINANASRNRNSVNDLKGTESLFLGGFAGSSSRVVEGQQIGVLWGGKFDRDEKGNYVEDKAATGFPAVAENEGVLGDPNPKWRGGIGSTVAYKNLSMDFLFEFFNSAQYWNGTFGVLNYFGRTMESANEVTISAADAATMNTYAGDVVSNIYTADASGNYVVRGNVKDFGFGNVLLDESWYTSTGGGFGPVGEQFVTDASWTRLRNVSINYKLASEGLKRATKLSSIDFSLNGRNLWLLTDWVGIDPETNLTGAGSARGLEYFNNPNTKSFVFSVKFNY